MRSFHDYPGVPHTWEHMVDSTEMFAKHNESFRPLADLVAWLAASHFRAAGLCGVLSMHDLIVGPSRSVLANPYLVVSFRPDHACFELMYEDGSPEPWVRVTAPDAIRATLERFLVKRARWYKKTSASD